MKHRQLIGCLLALSSLAFGACGDNATQPDQPEEPQGPGSPAFAVAHDTWLNRRDMPLERFDLSTAGVPNAAGQSILYAMGGANSVGVPLGRVQAYNAATDTWAWKKDMPMALRDMNGAGVINGKIYISGGVSTAAWWKGWLPILLVYDPATNTWARKRDMPEGGSLGVTGVIDGKLYVVTGRFGGSFGNEGPLFFRYNPVTDRWVRLPSPKANDNKGAVLYSKLYVVGSELEMYDPATNQWTTKAKPPSDVYGAAVSMGAKLYLFGQNTNWSPGSNWGNYVYNPGTDTWSSKTPPPPLFNFSASRVFVNGQPRIEAVGRSYSGPNNVQYVP